MNFWFCETCGKRLTENDLAAGDARDKKLKGVYCQSCSVGVMTMEMDAISNDDIQKIKRKTGGSGESRIRVPKSSGDSFQRINSPQRRPSGESFPSENVRRDSNLRLSPAQARGRADLFPLKLGGGVLVAVVIVAVMALLTRHPSAMPATPATPAAPAPEPAPIAETHVTQPAPRPTTVAPESIPATELNSTVAALEPPAVAVLAPVAPPAVHTADAPGTETPGVPDGTAKTSALVNTPEPAKIPAATADRFDNELLSNVVHLLSQHRLTEATLKVRESSGGENSKQQWLAVLSAVQKEEKEFQDQLSASIGKDVKLQTARESVDGKLTLVEFPLLRIAKVISDNGTAIGSTNVTVSAYDLTEAARQAFYRPGDADGDGWAARALLALSAMRLAEAENALSHLSDHPLKDGLAAEIKRMKSVALESQARAAWTSLSSRVKEATTQARAKQLCAEVDAFEKNFADSEFIRNSDCSAALKAAKERLERLSVGLDPRVQSLFKGRVASYDAPTGVMTLEYDFSTKQQTDDFVGAVWAPPGDFSGLTWNRGKLSTYGKMPVSVLLPMPQFISSTISVQMDVPVMKANTEKNVVMCWGFYNPQTTAKSPRIRVDLNGKTCTIFSDDNTLKSVPSILTATKPCKLEFSCLDKALSVKINGQVLLECKLDKAIEQTGFWFGNGWDSGITLSRFQISGRLDPVWLANALKAAH